MMPLASIKLQNIQFSSAQLRSDVRATHDNAPLYPRSLYLLWSTAHANTKRIVRWFQYLESEDCPTDKLKQEIEFELDPDSLQLSYATGRAVSFFIFRENLSPIITSHHHVPIPSLTVVSSEAYIENPKYTVGYAVLAYKHVTYNCVFIKSNNIDELINLY